MVLIMSKRHKNILIIVSAIVISLLSVFNIVDAKLEIPEEVSYNQFLEDVHGGKVDTVYYTKDSEKMRYTLFTDESKDLSIEDRKKYEYDRDNWRITYYPAYDEFRRDLLESGVRLEVKSFEPAVFTLIQAIVPLVFTVLLISMLISLMRQMTRVGKLDNKGIIQTSNVRFKDVIGHDEVVDDIKFMVDLLRNPKLGEKTGARVPKGVLFSGEPGTGKTLLAKAIAGEANVPFIYVNASSLVEMYVGVGAKRVREIFKIAKKNSPCIIFIDEIDAVGGSRGRNEGSTEHSQTLNALLTEMDGFDTGKGIIIIGATNREDKLDKALIRAGRFDRRVIVAPPRTWQVRKKLFEHYLEGKKLEGVDVDSISKQVVGFTGADIEAVVNEASLITAMQGSDTITTECIEEAIDKKVFQGNRSKEEKYFEDKRVVAYHEAGHAVTSYLLGIDIARASIVGTTSGVGGAVFNQDKDSQFLTDEDFRNKIKVCYGGRASEEIKFGAVTTGASSDITKATGMLQSYVQRYGFDNDFGLLDIDVLDRYVDTDKVLSKYSELSKELYSEVKVLLSQNYDLVEKLATKLLQVETLSGDSIIEVLKLER